LYGEWLVTKKRRNTTKEKIEEITKKEKELGLQLLIWKSLKLGSIVKNVKDIVIHWPLGIVGGSAKPP
jgi:hypothetical protein